MEEHTITEFKEWPKGLEVSYHDWVIKASKEEIAKKIGFKPKYYRGGPKCTYVWRCNLDNGRYFFTIYDMSYGRRLGKNDVIEYHIGFDCTYDDIHEFWPNKVEALDMLGALNEIGLTPCHSDLWVKFHATGTFKKIEGLFNKNIDKTESTDFNSMEEMHLKGVCAEYIKGYEQAEQDFLNDDNLLVAIGDAYVDWIDGGINTNDANPADYIREHIHKQ